MYKKIIKKIFEKKPGETLIEIIVAMAVLSIGTLTASSLIVSTIRSTVINKNYLVGLNLSREGIEAVRAIRDTNWLVFSHDTAACWDVINDQNVSQSDCSDAQKFTQLAGKTYFRVNFNADSDAVAPYKWVLDKAANNSFTPGTSSADRRFFLLEPDNTNAGFYRHQLITTGVNEYASDGTSFYRAIVIEPVDNTTDEIRVVSAVHWLEGSEFKELITETILTNYQS